MTTMEDTGSRQFADLLQLHFKPLPQVGDVVRGVVIAIDKGEVTVDVQGVAAGIVRGPQLYTEGGSFDELKPGDEVEATIIDLENERGEMELSFRGTGARRSWEAVDELKQSAKTISVKITEANRGGLIATVEGLQAFMPVSQLNPEHYPRVSGGEKAKILEKLRELVGTTLAVKVIDIDSRENKLIISEKAVWEDAQKQVLSAYHIGDMVKGEVSALTSFGAFIRFGDNLEGLVHISEIAWQRIDAPRDLLKIGDKVRAQIIQLDGSKIFLSMKRLVEDPWKSVESRYNVGQKVMGRVLKINPFGLFVELDPEIHGLAHVSEISDKPVTDISTIAKEGDILEFEIVSIEANDHRLGLKIPGVKSRKRPPEAAPAATDTDATGANPDASATSATTAAADAEQSSTPDSAPAPEAPAGIDTTPVASEPAAPDTTPDVSRLDAPARPAA